MTDISSKIPSGRIRSMYVFNSSEELNLRSKDHMLQHQRDAKQKGWKLPAIFQIDIGDDNLATMTSQWEIK